VVEGGGGSDDDFPSFSLVSSISLLSPLLRFFRYLLFFSSVSSWAVSVAVRWCAVAVERKHGGSCGCSSSLVFFLFLPLSLPVLPRFFVGFPFSPLSPLKMPPFCNISLRSFPAFSSLFFPLFLFSFLLFRSLSLHPFLSQKILLSLFSSSFFSSVRAVFIGARGAGSTLPYPIVAHGAHSPPALSRRWERWPMGASLAWHDFFVYSS